MPKTMQKTMPKRSKSTKSKSRGPRGPRELRLEIVQGVGGLAVYLNDFRIAGMKPWGGGKVVQRWILTDWEVREALATTPEGRMRWSDKQVDWAQNQPRKRTGRVDKPTQS